MRFAAEGESPSSTIHKVLDPRTSRLNSTPPIGEPKATLIPEAAAADRTSLLRAV